MTGSVKRVREGGADEGGREWGAPGWQRVQLNSPFTVPPLVVKFSDASAPKDQNFMNSVTVAPRNWELDADMLDLEEEDCPNTGSPCGPELYLYLHIQEVHH